MIVSTYLYFVVFTVLRKNENVHVFSRSVKSVNKDVVGYPYLALVQVMTPVYGRTRYTSKYAIF